jgi:hypothetical protein
MSLGTIVSLLPLGLDFFEGWQERKQEIKLAEHAARKQAAESGVALRNRKAILYTSFWMVAYPYISMFIPVPALRQYTLESFEEIAKLPPVAMWSWLLVLGAIWGVGIKDIPAKLWKK